jgi:hypothetical protein
MIFSSGDDISWRVGISFLLWHPRNLNVLLDKLLRIKSGAISSPLFANALAISTSDVFPTSHCSSKRGSQSLTSESHTTDLIV